jgi:glucose-1-phosphate cytidylyltransferase
MGKVLTSDLKVVILAGGLGTRLGEETHLRPKPMVEVGGMPILWHIMKIYSSYGFRKFIICCGYKSYVIKEFFSNYFLHLSDMRISLRENKTEFFNSQVEDWEVTLVDTGLNTMTGGRLLRVAKLLDGEKYFMMTYGDGVADVNLDFLLRSHCLSGLDATITAVRPPARFGAIGIVDGVVSSFYEKPIENENLINGGFFVLNPSVFSLIGDDSSVWEDRPLRELASSGRLNAYVHEGFWRPMDTLRDKQQLEREWQSGQAPWAKW